MKRFNKMLQDYLQESINNVTIKGYNSINTAISDFEHYLKTFASEGFSCVVIFNINLFEDNLKEAFIDTKTYCNKDKGVRGLKKCIETIMLKINTARFLGSRLKYKSLKEIKLPFEISEKVVKELLPEERNHKEEEILSHMYL